MSNQNTKSTYSMDNVSGLDALNVSSSLFSTAMKAESYLTMGRANTRTLKFNAGLEDKAADDAIKQGVKNSYLVRRNTKNTVGEQRANLAAQGVEVNTDTASDIQQDTEFWGAVDELAVQNNAFMQAYGHKMNALNLRTQAETERLTTDYKYRMTLIEGGMQAGEKMMKAMAGGG